MQESKKRSLGKIPVYEREKELETSKKEKEREILQISLKNQARRRSSSSISSKLFCSSSSLGKRALKTVNPPQDRDRILIFFGDRNKPFLRFHFCWNKTEHQQVDRFKTGPLNQPIGWTDSIADLATGLSLTHRFDNRLTPSLNMLDLGSKLEHPRSTKNYSWSNRARIDRPKVESIHRALNQTITP